MDVATIIGALGGLALASMSGVAAVIRARRGERPTDPGAEQEPQLPPRSSSPYRMPPSQAPTRAEHEVLMQRVLHVEDALDKAHDTIARLDARLDAMSAELVRVATGTAAHLEALVDRLDRGDGTRSRRRP